MSISVSFKGPRADLVLSRPEVHNAIDLDGFHALGAAAAEIAANAEARVLVVRGEGPSFCSGIDTTTLGGAMGEPKDLVVRAQSGYRGLAGLTIPTIAAVHGHCYGAGLQLALACDLRVVTADAKLGLLEGKYGLVPDLGGTHRLPALVGPAIAKRMIWGVEKIDGIEAGRIGLAESVVEPDKLTETVDGLAERFAALSPRVARATKRLIDRAAGQPFEDAMDDVAAEQVEIMGSNDFAEAMSAFVERRPPRYTGR